MRPKKKCCVSRPRCDRCPIRLMAAGDLPPGYTVKKRRLVKVKQSAQQGLVVAADAAPGKKKKSKKAKKSKRAKISLAA